MDDSELMHDGSMANAITEAAPMSTFLSNMETLGGYLSPRIETFNRNLDVIKDSIVHRDSLIVKEPSSRDAALSRSRRGMRRTQ